MNSNAQLILVIDYDVAICKLIRWELSEQGFRTLIAGSGEEGLEMAARHRPDLIVLELILPDLSGVEVMRRVQEFAGTPVIILSPKMKGDNDQIRVLNLGADYCIAKPFNPEVLVAAIHAVLRRTAPVSSRTQSVVRAGNVEVDLNKRVVTKNGSVVLLSRTEWNLVEVFAREPGKVMMNGELLTRVWGPEYRGDLQYLRVWITRLRRKLDDSRESTIFKTFPGIGYLFVVDDEEEVSKDPGKS